LGVLIQFGFVSATHRRCRLPRVLGFFWYVGLSRHSLSSIRHLDIPCTVSRASAQHTAALYIATAKGEKTSLVQIIYPALNIRDKESLTKTRTETTPLLGVLFCGVFQFLIETSESMHLKLH
jgi:hypothetical protein